MTFSNHHSYIIIINIQIRKKYEFIFKFYIHIEVFKIRKTNYKLTNRKWGAFIR